MRREIPVLADIYPAGEETTCDHCGTKNLSGESFHHKVNFFAPNEHLCPDCYKAEKEIKKEEERQRYIDGEEEPWGTDEVVCPWCGYEHGDSWEMADYDDECECEECGKMFAYERNVTVTYSSERVEATK